MLSLFQYNWQVREDWLNWCQSISEEEFHKDRIGGMKSIKETLIHIIDCELLWLNSMVEKTIFCETRNSINQLKDIRAYSAFVKSHTKYFIEQLTSENENRIIEVKRRDGTILHFTQKKILAHMITHEVHHIGQLSIWARELQLKPISSDLIIRNYD
ncbi:DinB family protein [Solibacillus sp. MA9]|uniref:DinB family protein n=1 Tax=Solibacillus palustris TaxID=2908203 RepID=A0ABS9UEI5_9BACL|nr:DinB family protein [Solibacillus sp. MA9]MCH7322760.1 DinB family protein [Solibacillus sp. MA9]